MAFEPQLTVFPCCQFHVTGALSWALWERRTPSAPSAQSQEKQAAFTSHSHSHPHPQPHTAGTLFQTGFPERTRCLLPHPVSICIAQILPAAWQMKSTWGPNYTHLSSLRGQSFHYRNAMSRPGATTHHRVPTPKEGCHWGRGRTLVRLQWCGAPIQRRQAKRRKNSKAVREKTDFIWNKKCRTPCLRMFLKTRVI